MGNAEDTSGKRVAPGKKKESSTSGFRVGVQQLGQPQQQHQHHLQQPQMGGLHGMSLGQQSGGMGGSIPGGSGTPPGASTQEWEWLTMSL